MSYMNFVSQGTAKMDMPDLNLDAVDFWEKLYRKKSPKSGGQPSATLERFLTDREPGEALELGCAKGDDAVWLAKKGWQVTAVDISETALSYAETNAQRQGVSDRIDFQQHDLSVSFPDIRCDLVTAMFLQTPLDFPRNEVLKKAAHSLNSGGLLLIVSHGARAPWSWAKADKDYPTARENLCELKLGANEWGELHVGEEKRMAHGPDNQKATVTDAIIFLRRL
jgi:SAM-dependent methyltransferase